MAKDPQEKAFGARVARDDAPEGEQDIEGHARLLNKDDSGIGETNRSRLFRNDAPEGDDDVEGHARLS